MCRSIHWLVIEIGLLGLGTYRWSAPVLACSPSWKLHAGCLVVVVAPSDRAWLHHRPGSSTSRHTTWTWSWSRQRRRRRRPEEAGERRKDRWGEGPAVPGLLRRWPPPRAAARNPRRCGEVGKKAGQREQRKWGAGDPFSPPLSLHGQGDGRRDRSPRTRRRLTRHHAPLAPSSSQ
jgi:hypothetical protein